MPGNRILELQQKRDAVVTKAADLLKTATTRGGPLTPEETTQYDAMFSEIGQYRATIDRETQQASIDSLIAERRQAVKDETGKPIDEQREAFSSWMRGGIAYVPDELRSLLVPGSQFASNFQLEQRAGLPQSELTGNVGGYVVPQGFYAQIQAALKFFGGMDDAGCSVLNTAMGNDLPVPTSNDTSITAIELGESSPAQVQEVSFGQVILKAYKYTSQIILAPLELLQDAGVDIEAYFTNVIVTRFGRIRNKRFTTGSGTNQPRGVLLDSVAGKTGLNGQGTGLLYDDLVDLKYSVNRAYRKNARFMCNDNTLKTILKIVDDNHRPLILDYLQTLAAGEPEAILGQRLVNNDDMPDLGTTGSPAVGNQAIAYGDFSNYWQRNVMAMLLMRLVERYAELGQVGFLAFMRFDGRMVDAGTHPVKAYVCPTS